MAYRYEAEVLLSLRDSPLVVRPASLPPAEEWLGQPPADQAQGRVPAKPTNDRPKLGDGLLLGPDIRRNPLDRTASRNTPNPEDVVLAPPRNSFGAASSLLRNGRVGDGEKGPRDADRQDRSDRLNFRNRAGESDGIGDRRDGRNNTFRRRGDQDESEGWSTVKPRKSFGHDGAERFHGRMGGGGAGGDRFGGRDDRRTRDDRETTRDTGDRRNRNLDRAAGDRDGDEAEGIRRSGLARGRSDPWSRDNNSSNNPNQGDAPVSTRERIDRAKSWRDRDNDDNRGADRYGERGNDRPYERRWDRDQRHERDPAWLDEPLDEQGPADGADEAKGQARTVDDLKKWMEAQKQRASKSDNKSEEKKPAAVTEPPREQEAPRAAVELAPEPELSKVSSVPAAGDEPRRDKFFAAYEARGVSAASPAGSKDPAKAKPSRFMGKVISAAPQEDARLRTEPSTPAAIPSSSGNGPDSPGGAGSNTAEKEAFQALLQKLQRSGLSSQGSSNTNTPAAVAAAAAAAPSQPPLFQPQPQPTAAFPSLPPMASDMQHKPSAMTAPEPFQHYGGVDRRMEEARMRTPQSALQSILSPRPMGPSAPPSALMRPEQALQDLLAQRHQASSQTSTRMAQNAAAAAVNNNTAFLMQLMQSHREAPEPQQRIDPQQLMRMPQPTKQQSQSVANIMERAEHPQPDFGRDVRSLPQARQMRMQQVPPGFLDDQQPMPPQYHHTQDMMDSRGPPQPTQILSRPPMSGMEHHLPFPMGGNGNLAGGAQLGGPPQQQQQQQQQQRPMIPPPGLVNAPPQSRMPPPPQQNMPPNMVNMPPNMQAMFANFPPGAFPPGPGVGVPQGPLPPIASLPHEGMRGLQPPPGFFGAPPPGFMAPHLGSNGFPGGGLDGPGFGAGPPFDRRNMMPPGTFRGM